MGQKKVSQFIWVNKHPQGKIIVNINHIVKIEIAATHVYIKLSDGSTVMAEYTADTIDNLFPIM